MAKKTVLLDIISLFLIPRPLDFRRLLAFLTSVSFLIHCIRFLFVSLLQVVCGQNCTFVIQPNGTVLACGEGSYGRLGQGNSDDLHVLTVISALQGGAVVSYRTYC